MRGPDRGRRSPPQQRNMDRRFPAPNQRLPADRRRPRSISPPPGRGRSPGPFNKRFRGQEQYDQPPRRYDGYEREFDMAYEEQRGGYPEQYGRVGPPSPRSRDGQPKTYKTFMMALDEHVTPEAAQKQYDEYLTAFWGSKRKAVFQSEKEKPEMRARFDPREQEKGLRLRNEEAQQAAKDFAEQLLTGRLNPAANDFNQGESPEAKEGAAETVDGADQNTEESNAPTAPAILWKPERIAADLKLSRQLIEKLDKEKGISSNPLIAADKLEEAPAEASKTEEKEPAKPAVAVDADKAQPDGVSEQPADAKSATEPAADGAKMDVDIDAALPSTTKDGSPTTTNYQVEVKTSEKSAAVSDGQAGDAGAHEATKEVKAEAQVEEGTEEGQEQGSVGKLDVHLTYLWRVHRVNYYVGGEWWDPCDRQAWASSKRMLRAPHPEEGEQADPDQEKLESSQVKKTVDQAWQLRLTQPDPLQKLLHQDEVEKGIEDWIEDKVIKHSDTKWGNQLSGKMFVGKDFVLKHIRTKHGEKVEEFKQQLYEQLYWDNYNAREEERIAANKQLHKEAMQRAAEANKDPEEELPPEMQHGSGFSLAGRVPVNDMDEAGPMDVANGVQRSGSSAGRGGKGGRGQMRDEHTASIREWSAGGRGRGMGGMRGPGMVLDPTMAPMGPGMMAGMQAMPGQMLMLAPGAGPMGPFLPIANAPMDMGVQMAGHRGQRGPGRGARQGRGGYGGQMGGRGGYGGRGYFDLDAPENQRSVLDYGDL